MSQSYNINIPAHYNIYTGKPGRSLDVAFSVPDGGVNERTGLLILVPGFGARIDSKVYQKMRSRFADQYNLVVLQCAYFGSRFMQQADMFHIDLQRLPPAYSKEEIAMIKQNPSCLLEFLQTKQVTVHVKAKQDESVDEFNDMGLMQAIDLITAIKAVETVLKENGIPFKPSRLMGYGHSHGAYLLHLANVMVPHLFTCIIDNSAWLEPGYLKADRHMVQSVGQGLLVTSYEYLARKIIPFKADLHLQNLYGAYAGNAHIIAFQGNDDNLVDHEEKRRIIGQIKPSTFILVTENDVDHKRYFSNKHGLDADFLELFAYAMTLEQEVGLTAHEGSYELELGTIKLHADFVTHPLPVFSFVRQMR